MGKLPVLFLSLPLACAVPETAPDYSPITEVWTGESIQIRVVDRPSNACRSTFSYLDRHYALVMADLGITKVPDEPKPILWWVSPDFFMDSLGCPAGVGGCVSYGEVHVKVLPHEHETVHLITQAFGGCHILLNEGLAEIYRGPMLEQSIDESMYTAIAEMTASRLPFDYYSLAGSFTDYIMRTYGTAALSDVCLRAPLGSTKGELDDAIRHVLGRSLQQIVDEYEQANVLQPAEYLRMPVTCASNDAVQMSIANPLGLMLDFECSDYVLGVEGAERRYQRRLDVMDGIEYTFTFDSSAHGSDSWIRIVSCEPGVGRISAWKRPVWNGDQAWVALDAGSYVLAISGQAGEQLSVYAEPTF